MPKNGEQNETKLYFGGYSKPNYTMVPDQLFDEQLPHLSGSELKVLLYIIRRTFGFKRESDTISLNQISNGITTHDGKVLDSGTGLAKRHVISALKSLQEMGLIMAERRSSPERGFEPTVYRLNIAPGPALPQPPLVAKGNKGSDKREQGLVAKGNIQETVLQETVRQKTDVVVVSAASLLENFGISKRVAEQLVQTYPEDYLVQKLDLAQWLVDTGSPLIAENPAGYLRRAIEDDYIPPKGYQPKTEREAEQRRRQEEEEERRQALEQEQQRRKEAEEAFLQAKQQTQERVRKQYPPQRIPGTKLTTETAWQEVLGQLRDQVTAANYNTWLKDTRLLSCNQTTAVVATPTSFAVEWLSKRFAPLIERVLSPVLGFPVRTEYMTIPELGELPLSETVGDATVGRSEEPETGKRRGSGGRHHPAP